jgi:hypothetical protein
MRYLILLTVLLSGCVHKADHDVQTISHCVGYCTHIELEADGVNDELNDAPADVIEELGGTDRPI